MIMIIMEMVVEGRKEGRKPIEGDCVGGSISTAPALSNNIKSVLLCFIIKFHGAPTSTLYYQNFIFNRPCSKC